MRFMQCWLEMGALMIGPMQFCAVFVEVASVRMG